MKQRIIRSIRITKILVHKEIFINLKDHFWTFLGSFLGIGTIGFINSRFLQSSDNLFLIGSFGASSVLIYGAINSPLSQPRNLVGGHLICAIIGVIIQKAAPGELWLSAALAVSLSIIAMQVTKTLHPPGGATALIAVIGSEKIQNLGFMYILSPVLSGVLILLLIALVVNNISSSRIYPAKKSRFKILNFPARVYSRNFSEAENEADIKKSA